MSQILYNDASLIKIKRHIPFNELAANESNAFSILLWCNIN
jgi:hypothetical protein